MGPDRANLLDRDADLLGHTGQRIGGNDFDIRLAVAELMPWCGMGSCNKRGLPMPSKLILVDAAGHRHMEYVNQRGAFDDLPLAQITADFHRVYGDWMQGAGAQGDFLTDVAREPVAGR